MVAERYTPTPGLNPGLRTPECAILDSALWASTPDSAIPDSALRARTPDYKILESALWPALRIIKFRALEMQARCKYP